MSDLTALLAEIRNRRDTSVTQAVQLIQLSSFETDTENRLASLRMAARRLSDEAVSAAWIESLADEKDPVVQRAKLDELAGLLLGLQVRAAHYTQASALIPSLVTATGDAALRPSALAVLAALVTHTPAAGSALAEAYRKIKDRNDRVAIVEVLAPLRFRWDGIVPFLKEALPDLTSDLKPAIVSFLLDREAFDEAAQLKLLSPGESSVVRFAVVAHWNDRSAPAGPALVEKFLQLVRTEPDLVVRAEVMLFLELHADALPAGYDDTLLEILRRDTEPRIRYAAARALARTGGDNPARLDKLAAALQAETREEMFAILLQLLTPHAAASNASGERIRSLFIKLLQGNLQTALAKQIVSALEKTILLHPVIGESLLAEFAASRDDRLAASLLEAIARQAPEDPKFTALYVSACASPAPGVRSAGLRGLAALPLTPEVEPLLLAKLELLNEPALNDEVRKRFGRKIARIPVLPAEAIARLKPIIAGLPTGGDLRRELETAITRVPDPAAVADETPDWDMWRTRLLKEKRTDGMLPALYLCYDRFPKESAALLKEIIKTPGHRADRFGGDFHRDDTILEFLRTKNAIDDEMSRYAAAFLLEKDNSWGDLNFYLGLLKSNLAFPALKETLWSALNREQTVNSINLTLLREVLFLGYGDDAQLAAAFIAQAQTKTTVREFAPYLKFLKENECWSRAIDVIVALQAALPSEIFAPPETQKIIAELYKESGLPMPVPKPAAPVAPAAMPGELLDE